MTRVDCVGTFTSSQPALARRSLEAHVRARREANRTHAIVVVDDARDAGELAACKEMVAEVSRSNGVDIQYADRRARVRFGEALASELRGDQVPYDTIAFALLGRDGCGTNAGASRNALALHAAGGVLFAVDEGVMPDLWLPRGSRASRAPSVVATDRDPRDLFSFSDRAAAICHVSSSSKNAVVALEELLGASVGYGSRAGRVAVTSFGLVGDSGARTPFSALVQQGPARIRVMAQSAAYRAACTSREVFHAAPSPSITDAPSFSGMAAGYDLASLLPPFVPCGYDADGLFGAMLRRVDRDALFGHLPWAVLHDPSVVRRGVHNDVRRAKVSVGGLIASLVAQATVSSAPSRTGDRTWPRATCTGPASPASTTVAVRLRGLGASLIEAAGATPSAFRDRAIAARRAMGAATIQGLDRLLAIYRSEPAEWAADVAAHQTAVRASIASGECVIPTELALLGDIEGVARLRRIVRDYGELLMAWPSIVEAARRLRSRGAGLAA